MVENALGCRSVPKPDSHPSLTLDFITKAAGQKSTGRGQDQTLSGSLNERATFPSSQETLNHRRVGNNHERNSEGSEWVSDGPVFWKPTGTSERWSCSTLPPEHKIKTRDAGRFVEKTSNVDPCVLSREGYARSSIWRWWVCELNSRNVVVCNEDILCFFPQNIHLQY